MHGSPPTQGVVEDDGGSFFTIFRRHNTGWIPPRAELHWPGPCITMDSVPPSEGGYSGSIPDMGIRALRTGRFFICDSFVVYRASFIVYSKSMMPSTPSTVMQATTATPTRPRPRSDAMTAATSAHAPESTLFVE